jgi:hypothetical protein
MYRVWITDELPATYDEAIEKALQLENENYHTEAEAYYDEADRIYEQFLNELGHKQLFSDPRIAEYEFVEGDMDY